MKKGKIALLLSLILIVPATAACGGTTAAPSAAPAAEAPAAEEANGAVEGFADGNAVQEYSDQIGDLGLTADVGAPASDGWFDGWFGDSSKESTAPSYRYDQIEPDVQEFNTEEYNSIDEQGFKQVALEPLSTFAADVDTGSYCNFRRMVNDGYTFDTIPSGALRVEEMLNYFDWDTSKGTKDGQFKVHYELVESPWNDTMILLATVEADSQSKTSDNNFVFLIDTSGSMSYDSDKIELAVKSFKKLASTLTDDDIVSIVTYAGSTTTLLDSCKGSDTRKINRALDKAEDLCNNYGGGTNGSGGITAAYEIASKNYIAGGNNRVIIASDGDMNLGISDQSGLVDLIKSYKDEGIYLTTLGFGAGNYSDANMEQIADAGNGNYFYIDCEREAERVLVDKMKQNTDVVAKDTKFQIEFNPAVVNSYRQIGYENRQMAASDFEDDTKDGGEVGAGQQVTIMYELVLGDGTQSKLRYQETKSGNSDELATIAIRYQEPNITGGKSKLLEFPIKNNYDNTISPDMNFALGVAETTLLIRDSEYKDGCNYEDALALLEAGINRDEYRGELADLLKTLYRNSGNGRLKASKTSEIGRYRMDYTHKPNSKPSGESSKSSKSSDGKITFRVLDGYEIGIDTMYYVEEACNNHDFEIVASRKVSDNYFGEDNKAYEITIKAKGNSSSTHDSDFDAIKSELSKHDLDFYVVD